MRADRLLSTIWLLRTHGQLSTAELAARLEVSRRTVLRDVDALSAAGVPVFCERGPRGGVRLLPGYRTDVTALSEEESRALFAAISSWGADAMGLGAQFASGVRKLLAAVPDAHRERSADVASRIVIDPQGWLPQPRAARPGDAFGTVQAAVLARERIRIVYRSRRAATVEELCLDPHGLVSAGRDWYLCARRDDEVRFFKVARIEHVHLLATPCADAELDVATAWREQRDRFLSRHTPVSATGWLRDGLWEDAGERCLRIEDDEPLTDAPAPGWRPVRLHFMDELHAITVLLGLGSGVRVDAPRPLRATLLEHVEQIARLYRTGEGGTGQVASHSRW